MAGHTTAQSIASRAVVLFSMLASFAAARSIPAGEPVDPFTDPKDDPFNPLHYIANNGLTAMAVALVLVVALPQTYFTWRIGGRFMLAMIIAEYTYTLGIAFRFGLHSNPDSTSLYILYYLFVTLSPCGFIAAEYVLLGRMARWLDGHQHVLIPPNRAAGGSISASAHEDPKKAQTGSRIFLAGLAMQLASFFFFTCVYIRFLYRMRKYENHVWVRDRGLKWYNDWRALAGAMFVSCIGILIRSVYRTIELSEGFDGFLTRTEVYFFVLDFVPLLIALIAYVPFWPGRFIPKGVTFSSKPEEPQRQSADGTLQDQDKVDTPVVDKE